MGIPGTGNSMCKGAEVTEWAWDVQGVPWAWIRKFKQGRGQRRGWGRDRPGHPEQGPLAQESKALSGKQWETRPGF